MFNNTETNITPETLDLDFIKKYLRIEHDLDDIELTVYLAAAQSYVRTYVKAEYGENLSIDLIIPILSIIAHCYENKTVNIKSTEKVDAMFRSILDMHRGDIL